LASHRGKKREKNFFQREKSEEVEHHVEILRLVGKNIVKREEGKKEGTALLFPQKRSEI